MNFKRDDLDKMMSNLGLNKKIFSEDDYKLIEKGGIAITDSDTDHQETDSMGKSVSSVDIHDTKANFQNILMNKLAKEKERENKNKYGSIVLMLEKQVSQLQQENNKLKVEKDREVHQVATDFQKKFDKTANEQNRTNNLKKYVHAKDVLDILGDVVNDRIPENDYIRLRDLPERNLREDEANLVHIWELVFPLKHENSQLKVEMNKLREQIRQDNERYQNVLSELNEATTHLARKDDDVKRTMNSYETSIKLLQSELNKSTLELEGIREKGIKYDELYRDFVKLEKEKMMLENKVSFFSGTPDLVHEAPKNESDLRAKYSILCTDKEYLTRENIRLVEQNRKLEDKIDRLEREIDENKKMSKDYMMQLFNSKNTLFLDYEKKISTELTDLRDKHRSELENAKNNMRDVYERQVSFLKDTKEELELKMEHLESVNKEKAKAYDEVLTENRNLQRRVDYDLSELRIQLRIKTDELEKTHTLYDEANNNVKMLKLENDKMREKINVLKSEYYRVEASAKEESSGVRAQLAVAKEQLANYELIEKEIDDAVNGLSKGDSFDGGLPTNIYLHTLTSAPTSSKRRIQQAIGLAQKLNVKQRENEELLKKLRDSQNRLEQAEQEGQLAKSLLDKSAQPYQYLISNIEDKEKEVIVLKQKVKAYEEELRSTKAENNKLIEDYGVLQRDLNKVMIKRENIKNIQRILIRLLSENRENISHQDIYQLVDEMNYITDGKGKDPLLTMAGPDPNETVEKGMYTPPTKLYPGSKTYGGPTGGIQAQNMRQTNGPGWFNKLKDTLKDRNGN
jgi:progesterone-induced-blocking factor 1